MQFVAISAMQIVVGRMARWSVRPERAVDRDHRLAGGRGVRTGRGGFCEGEVMTTVRTSPALRQWTLVAAVAAPGLLLAVACLFLFHPRALAPSTAPLWWQLHVVLAGIGAGYLADLEQGAARRPTTCARWATTWA